MLKKLLYTIFTTTAILSWSLLAHANCPAVPANGGTIELTTGANCSYNASDFANKNITIIGDGDISINGDINFTNGSSLTISSSTAKVTFEGTVTVSGGSIINNGIIELKKDYKQTGGKLITNSSSTIKGSDISFDIAGGNFSHSGSVIIDNTNSIDKTVSVAGGFADNANWRDIDLNEGSLFAVTGSDLTLKETQGGRGTIAGNIQVLDGDLNLPGEAARGWDIYGRIVVLDTDGMGSNGFLNILHYPSIVIKEGGSIITNGINHNGNEWSKPVIDICAGDLYLPENHNLCQFVDLKTCDGGDNNSACSAIKPLPVSLTEFTAKIANETVQVNWETASETNNDFFTLLRSQNGSQFNEIATIAGMGNTVEPQQYEYIDKNPLAGLSYYRLSQTDFDGTTTMHNIVPVFYNTISANFSAFGYRLNGIASIQCKFPANDFTNTVRIYSTMGELLFEETIAAGILEHTINMQLQASVYIVTNTNNNITSSIKMLIQ